MAMETSTTLTEGSSRNQRNHASTTHTAHHLPSAPGKPSKSTKINTSRSCTAKIPSPPSRNTNDKKSENTKQSIKNARFEKANTKPNQAASENPLHVLPNEENVAECLDIRDFGSKDRDLSPKDRDHGIPVLEECSFAQIHVENTENAELLLGVSHSDPVSSSQLLQESKSKPFVTEEAAETQAFLVDLSSSQKLGSESVVEEGSSGTENVEQLHAVESKEKSLDGTSLQASNDNASLDRDSTSVPQGDEMTDDDLIKHILETNEISSGIDDGSYAEHLNTEQEKFLFSKGQSSVNGTTNDNVEVESLSVLPSPSKKNHTQSSPGDLSATAACEVTQEVVFPLPYPEATGFIEADMSTTASSDALVLMHRGEYSCKATNSIAPRMRVSVVCLVLALALVCSTWFLSGYVDEMHFPPPT